MRHIVSARDFGMGKPEIFTHNHVEYVSTAEAARLLGVAANSVRRLGLMPYWPLGTGKRGVPCYFKRIDVDALEIVRRQRSEH